MMPENQSGGQLWTMVQELVRDSIAEYLRSDEGVARVREIVKSEKEDEGLEILIYSGTEDLDPIRLQEQLRHLRDLIRSLTSDDQAEKERALREVEMLKALSGVF